MNEDTGSVPSPELRGDEQNSFKNKCGKTPIIKDKSGERIT
jgi:hypothetical protein